MPEIVSIVYTPGTPDYVRPEDRYAREPLAEAELVPGRGIRGDRKGRFEERQINLMAAETLAALAGEGFRTGPGQMGEQLVVRGLDVDRLRPGDRLRLGERVVLEVIKRRTGCDRFERIQGQRKAEAAGRLGQMLRVLEGGTIRVGDPVAAVAPADPATAP